MSQASDHAIHTLSEFLLHGGTNFQIFDLGRGVHPMDTQFFLELENGMRPCPRPRQQHAWFAIVFWSEGSKANHYIWFVKFPIDERGLLVAAARNHFLQIILDALGQSLSEEKQDTLPDNPYSFVPNQSQMAQFSAVSKSCLSLPFNEGVNDVAQYINAPAISDWRKLSVQSIADFAQSLTDQSTCKAVMANMPLFHAEFTRTLLAAAETVSIPSVFKQFCAKHCTDTLASDPTVALAALRALSNEQPDSIVHAVLDTLLNSSQLDIHVLSVIAGRHYAQLTEHRLTQFFEHAAALDEAESMDGKLFAGFFSDLVQLPMLRAEVLAVLRATDRSDTLARAFGHLFSQTQKK
ncbi:DUF3549 family protein [Alteromonas sp. C1M14]|uniref:DUF3549 family protein n=1 Tax=Alteromonas sp. C1M14 TaxID=2841567 RepID=UPI001C08E46F|nr:DUF3549 family protein [Alteromonas sp. C1M14]MBU2977856.1 DUF3549 family protein [Alteromonas sp. C1M14]